MPDLKGLRVSSTTTPQAVFADKTADDLATALGNCLVKGAKGLITSIKVDPLANIMPKSPTTINIKEAPMITAQQKAAENPGTIQTYTTSKGTAIVFFEETGDSQGFHHIPLKTSDFNKLKPYLNIDNDAIDTFVKKTLPGLAQVKVKSAVTAATNAAKAAHTKAVTALTKKLKSVGATKLDLSSGIDITTGGKGAAPQNVKITTAILTAALKGMKKQPNQNVTSLTLSGQGLTSLSAELVTALGKKLPNLQNLDLSNNNLSTIPDDLNVLPIADRTTFLNLPKSYQKVVEEFFNPKATYQSDYKHCSVILNSDQKSVSNAYRHLPINTLTRRLKDSGGMLVKGDKETNRANALKVIVKGLCAKAQAKTKATQKPETVLEMLKELQYLKTTLQEHKTMGGTYASKGTKSKFIEVYKEIDSTRTILQNSLLPLKQLTYLYNEHSERIDDPPVDVSKLLATRTAVAYWFQHPGLLPVDQSPVTALLEYLSSTNPQSADGLPPLFDEESENVSSSERREAIKTCICLMYLEDNSTFRALPPDQQKSISELFFTMATSQSFLDLSPDQQKSVSELFFTMALKNRIPTGGFTDLDAFFAAVELPDFDLEKEYHIQGKYLTVILKGDKEGTPHFNLFDLPQEQDAADQDGFSLKLGAFHNTAVISINESTYNFVLDNNGFFQEGSDELPTLTGTQNYRFKLSLSSSEV